MSIGYNYRLVNDLQIRFSHHGHYVWTEKEKWAFAIPQYIYTRLTVNSKREKRCLNQHELRGWRPVHSLTNLGRAASHRRTRKGKQALRGLTSFATDALYQRFPKLRVKYRGLLAHTDSSSRILTFWPRYIQSILKNLTVNLRRQLISGIISTRLRDHSPNE